MKNFHEYRRFDTRMVIGLITLLSINFVILLKNH